jgi:hypothetical protein
VIVKDFSRLGRDYIETGNYIEKIFPLLGVRFISVTDGYDSLQPMNEPEQMGMQLKNLVNEMYARDISDRVKTAKKVKKEQGGYTGGTPPYGYTIVKEGGRRVLSPDPEAAPILRMIFEAYHREYHASDIIRELYARGIHRPKDARKYAHVICQPGEILQEWDYAGLKFILQNELYIGGEGTAPVTEALVERDIFERIQEHFRENARRFRTADTRIQRSRNSYTGGMLICGECGAVMERVSNRKGGTYHCRNGGRIDQLACQHKYTSVQELDPILETIRALEWWLAGIQAVDLEASWQQVIERQQNKCLIEITKIEKKEYQSMQNLTLQYETYRAGKLRKEDFLRCRADQERERITFVAEKEAWQQKIQKWSRMRENIQNIKNAKNPENPESIESVKNGCVSRDEGQEKAYFVTQIKFFTGKRMEISYDFTRKY